MRARADAALDAVIDLLEAMTVTLDGLALMLRRAGQYQMHLELTDLVKQIRQKVTMAGGDRAGQGDSERAGAAAAVPPEREV